MEIKPIDNTARVEAIIANIIESLEEVNECQHRCDGDTSIAEAVGKAFSSKGYFCYLMYYEPNARFQYLKVCKRRRAVSTGIKSWYKEV